MAHPLHKEIGKRAVEAFGSNVLLDPACGCGHDLPLYANEEKAKESEFCEVDMLILKGEEVKVIFEIEEANIKPTQICGRMLTSALSKYYIFKGTNSPDEGKKYPISSSTMFVQVVDVTKLKKKNKKIPQFINIEKAIQENLRFKNDRLISYRLYPINGAGDKDNIDKIIADVQDFLK